MSQEFIVVTKKTAAQMLSVSVRTIDHLIAAGEIEVRRIGRRVVITRQSLSNFLLTDHPTRSTNRPGKCPSSASKKATGRGNRDRQ
jgi:excisionase family DNA binding protein